MTTLAQIGRKALAVQPNDTLVLTPRLARWYDQHPDPTFSPHNVERIASLLRGEHKMERAGRFGPSGRGSCPRQQMFSYVGAPKLPDKLGLQHVYWAGHQTHMLLQLVLLEAGLVDDIEVKVSVPTKYSGGLIDGIGTHPDDWRYGVDIKTTSATPTILRDTQEVVEGWMRSSSYDMPEHWFAKHMLKAYLQTSSYMALTDRLEWDLHKFVLLYAHKGQGEHLPLREVVVERWPKAMDFVTAEVDTLVAHVRSRTLPTPLSSCLGQQGKAWDDCAYRHLCLHTTETGVNWPRKAVRIVLDRSQP